MPHAVSRGLAIHNTPDYCRDANPLPYPLPSLLQTFEELNTRIKEREAVPEEAEVEEDPSRTSAREALGEATRKAHHRAVQRVLWAEEKDYYAVLGIRRTYQVTSPHIHVCNARM